MQGLGIKKGRPEITKEFLKQKSLQQTPEKDGRARRDPFINPWFLWYPLEDP